MDVLPCQSPEMVEKEIWMHLNEPRKQAADA